MSRHTEDWDGPGTAFIINDAIGYLDSLTLFFWHAPRADLLVKVNAYEVPGRNFAELKHERRPKFIFSTNWPEPGRKTGPHCNANPAKQN